MKRVSKCSLLLISAIVSIWLPHSLAVDSLAPGYGDPRKGTGAHPPNSTGIKFDAPSLVDRLIGAGWPRNAAEKVMSQNHRRYKLLFENAPEELEREISTLSRLKVEKSVADALDRDPSLAGLFCLANRPSVLAKSLLAARPGTDNYERIKGTFVVRIDGWEIDRWAKMVERHGHLISRLIQGGIIQPDALLNYPLDESDASVAYGQWLEDLFKSWPQAMGDDSFGLLCSYVGNSGNQIFARMKRDERFRSRFNSEIWPALRRLSEKDPDILLFQEVCGVWDLLLQRKDGERLLGRAGIAAAEFLAGDQAIPESVREEVAQYLLFSDWKMIDQIERYKLEPALIALIERDVVGPRYLSSILDSLDAEGDNYPDQLKYLSERGNQALSEELQPVDPGAISWFPGYSSYALLRKSAQGRRITGLDWIGAGMDVVEFGLLLSPVKGMSAAIQKMAKEGTDRTVKKVVREIGERAGKEIAEAASDNQMTSVLGSKALGQLSRKTRTEILEKGTIEITDVIRGGFKFSESVGLNRESFKKITGLEARIFMRNDGRVYVSLPELVAGRTESAKFINEIATSIAMVVSLEAISEAYGEQLSAWWLAHASGNLDDPAS